MEEIMPYSIYLDYKGYIIEPRSYRVMPAPLMGTRFASGRQAYSNLDFWQVGAMTDWTHGINQKFLVDPSAFFLSVGIDCSKAGQIQLERDLVIQTLPTTPGVVTARYRSIDALYLGTDTGKILKSINGTSFTLDGETGTGKIYGFYELAGKLFATKGTYKSWVLDGTWKEVKASLSGTLTFTNGSITVTGTETLTGTLTFAYGSYQVIGIATKFLTELQSGVKVMLTTDSFWLWVTVNSIIDDTHLTLTANYLGAGGTGIVKKALTKFTTELWPGAKIMLESDGIWVGVSSIIDDTHLTLMGTGYTGTGGSGISKLALEDLYFVMVESDYGFGLFNDGIRRSIDGYSWVPVPPDPLWNMPTSEGIGLNAIAIPRGFLMGSQRGLWVFIGGSSGVNLYSFPDYVSTSNFAGMERWGNYGIFSIEHQGIFYTEGVQTYPTNLNYLNEGFVFKTCKSIVSSGWDLFALVSDGTDWYLARCNLNYTQVPKYWWLVKKLSKAPAYLASYSDYKVFIFYDDGTAQYYDKSTGIYQAEGYIITSLIDENLVRLQKQYKSISAIFESFPTSTTAKIAYRHSLSGTFTEQSFTGIAQREAVYILRNAVIENRIQIKLTLATTNTAKTPEIADLCWTYILASPSDENAIKKNFYFTVVAQDKIEQLTGAVEEIGRSEPRKASEIISDIWTTRAKKELLNFIGADNKRELGLEIAYTGSGTSCLLTIDRTNYEIVLTVDGVVNQTKSYKDLTLKGISDIIDALADYACSVHQDQEDTRTAHDLEPIENLEIKGGAHTYVGSDIFSVIFNPQAPGQSKLDSEGGGSDRLNMSLRET